MQGLLQWSTGLPGLEHRPVGSSWSRDQTGEPELEGKCLTIGPPGKPLTLSDERQGNMEQACAMVPFNYPD